ncbi:transmembrane protease serine 3-like [Pollicipes pollicipes]|uniref:transmembrane protease serine 3-like n=1 Tax=Pollicipes pollicipes TaxID=41117 RepID=UPI001884DD84|nr:transmembrane protease serine 3-like [Pollicipes pollicipes]
MPALETSEDRGSMGKIIGCGTRTVSKGFHYIQSPNFPRPYRNNFICSYRLWAENRGVLSMSCGNFTLEDSPRCRYDYMLVGGRRYCGTQKPRPVLNINRITATFCSDCKGTYSGYRCLIESRAPGSGPDSLRCGSHRLNPGTYTITSLNHPASYENYLHCSWTLRAAFRNDRISVRCSKFDLESVGGCRYDWLSVNGRRYCGRRGPRVTSTNQMTLEFSTDFSVVRPGFRCTVRVTASTCRCGVRNSRSRIAGGNVAQPSEHPWQVALTHGRTFIGGGTIINNQYVLTAAHCVAGLNAYHLKVFAREHNRTTSDGELGLPVSSVIVHPSFSNESLAYDVALLRLSRPLNFVAYSNQVAPACLPARLTEQYVNRLASVTGWGGAAANSTPSDVLRELNVRIISNSACQAARGTAASSVLCALSTRRGHGLCTGDAGGGLTYCNRRRRWEVVGVVSAGELCGATTAPGIYTRVTSVLSWIRECTVGATTCP